MNQSRRPESCPFRRDDDSVGSLGKICELAGSFLGKAAKAECPVALDTCEACCRHPLGLGSRVNPVVASLLFTAVKHARERFPPGAQEQVAIHQTRQFALRWLATVPKSKPNVGVDFDAVGDSPVGPIPRTNPADNGRPLRIGLVGRHSPFGLGHQNHDIAVHLHVDRWLIPRCAADQPPRGLACRIDSVSRHLGLLELEAWLDDLDVLIFVEMPVFPGLLEVAQQMGVRVVCVPNWEWLHPGLEWIDNVDLMLCPTRYTAGLLLEWKRRFRFKWDVDSLSWPVDTNRFQFRRRYVCGRFVYVNGSGGTQAATSNQSSTAFRRKGLDVLLAAARLVPGIPIVVFAFPEDVSSLPRNVQLRPPPEDNSLLYCDGDVCVQPSHWEGIGLPLLECQATGMPLIATDLPPMCEHQPFALIPAVPEAAYLNRELCIPAARICPEDLAGVLRSVHGRLIFTASGRARRFVEREHSWHVAKPKMLRRIAALVSNGRESQSPGPLRAN